MILNISNNKNNNLTENFCQNISNDITVFDSNTTTETNINNQIDTSNIQTTSPIEEEVKSTETTSNADTITSETQTDTRIDDNTSDSSDTIATNSNPVNDNQDNNNQDNYNENNSNQNNASETETTTNTEQNQIQYVTVPNLVGLDYNTAASKIRECNLDCSITDRLYTPNKNKSDTVAYQSLKAGTKVEKDSSIDIKMYDSNDNILAHINIKLSYKNANVDELVRKKNTYKIR